MLKVNWQGNAKIFKHQQRFLLQGKNKAEQKTVIKVQVFKMKSHRFQVIHVTADSPLLEVTAGQN